MDAGHVGALVKALARGIFEARMSRDRSPGVSNWKAWKMGAFTAKDRPLPPACSPPAMLRRAICFLMAHDTGQLGGAPTASLQGRTLDRRAVPCQQPPCKEKRILATWAFGEAWGRFNIAQCAHMRLSTFLVTGCGLTLTGKNDHLSQVQGAPPQGLDAAHNDSRRPAGMQPVLHKLL